jgi:TonB family protein
MEIARVQPFQTPGRRRMPRYAISVPVSVTVLRSGVPEGVPGRSVDVCEGGLCAVLAAELVPGEMVGVEFRLPHLSLAVLAKAKVRHYDRLRCGMQFLGLSGEQQATIRYWAERTGQRRTIADMAEAAQLQVEADEKAPLPEAPALQLIPPTPRTEREDPEQPHEASEHRQGRWDQRVVLILLAVFALTAAGMSWWHWEQGWAELESRIPDHHERPARAAANVSGDVMRRLLIHQVDPVAPTGANGQRMTGTVSLRAVIGRDGNVISLQPGTGANALTRAAMDAVRWWRFEPYRVHGDAVDVETTLTIQFE